MRRIVARYSVIGFWGLMCVWVLGLQVFPMQRALAEEPVGVHRRPVNIWSDGTRLSGDLWFPEGFPFKDKRPALIL